jgi:hypothetical protein
MKSCLLILLLLLCFVSTCFCQEVATIKIPQFSRNRSLSARQDVCDRYYQYENKTVSLHQALDGLQLHVVAAETPYFLTMLGPAGEPMINPNYPGLSAVLMDELASRAGFDWR